MRLAVGHSDHCLEQNAICLYRTLRSYCGVYSFSLNTVGSYLYLMIR